MKYPNDTIGNRTRDLPAYSAVPQPPRAHLITGWSWDNIVVTEAVDLRCVLPVSSESFQRTVKQHETPIQEL